MKNKKFRIILYSFFISFVFLLLCTKNSPLYKMNDWQDVNAFFTMGKSMINGLVPYVDLFEQKGPLLYLIYGIASLISDTSFIGVFVLEVLFFTVSLYYISKIVSLFIKEEYSYLLLPLFSVITLTSWAFTHGGSCEEFCFPFIIISLYYFLKYLKNSTISNREIITVGILCGCILWMKYTLLGFHLGFIIVVLINSYIGKDYKCLIRKVLYFLLGFTIVTVPWIIYFLINNGLDKLIDVYFIFNMTSYGEKLGIIEKLFSCFILICKKLFIQYDYLLLILIPLLLSIKFKIFFKDRKNNIFLLISLIFLLFGIYIGGTNYRYYALPTYIFTIFGFIFVVKTFSLFPKKEIFNSFVIMTLVVNIWCLALIYYKSGNIKYLYYKKDDYAQFVFAEIIGSNKTILNYGFLDGGFYFSTNTVPQFYYFEKQNVSYENYKENMDEQDKYLKEGKADYVVIKNRNKGKELKLKENYVFIMSHKQTYENKIIEYSLYKKK